MILNYKLISITSNILNLVAINVSNMRNLFCFVFLFFTILLLGDRCHKSLQKKAFIWLVWATGFIVLGKKHYKILPCFTWISHCLYSQSNHPRLGYPGNTGADGHQELNVVLVKRKASHLSLRHSPPSITPKFKYTLFTKPQWKGSWAQGNGVRSHLKGCSLSRSVQWLVFSLQTPFD